MSGLVAGIGFRRGTDAAEIFSLIQRALAAAQAGPEHLRVVATAADRACEPAIRDAAARFGLAPVGIEPAALAAAGPHGHIVLTRIASAGATCALAQRGRDPEAEMPDA